MFIFRKNIDLPTVYQNVICFFYLDTKYKPNFEYSHNIFPDEKTDHGYRKLTEACQTKAKRRKNKGMIGIISTIGSKIA